MSGWEFDDAGDFGSEEAAHRGAERNHFDPRDISVRRSAGGVKLEVRRSALGDSGIRKDDRRDGRRSGW